MEGKEKQQYTCPMHPEIVKDAPGKCPKCGMNLIPIEPPGKYEDHKDHEGHKHVVDEYYCPMLCEGDKKYSAPGNCSVCGMHLEKVGAPKEIKLAPMPSIKKKKEFPGTHKHIESSEGEYYCPMLCEGDKKYYKPGNCPVCGMHLVKEQKLRSNAVEY